MEKNAWLLENKGDANETERAEWWANLHSAWTCIRGIFPSEVIDDVEKRVKYVDGSGNSRTLDDLNLDDIFNFVRADAFCHRIVVATRSESRVLNQNSIADLGKS